MKHAFIIAVLFALILSEPLVGTTDDFECKIPPGWKFKNASISRSGLKAVMFLQDMPYEGESASRAVPSRLIIFDKDNTILNDLSYVEPKHIKMTRDDNIILAGGVEETDNITVLDSHGRHLFDLSTKGREPYPALLGKEIGLGRSEIGERAEIVGSVSIIDAKTGREKISFGPPSGKGITGYSGFLPIGEGGQFLIAIGATVCLRSYLHPEVPLWRINDIGGNARAIIPIDENYIGIAYHQDDFKSKKYKAGVVVLDRHDGKILFRHESNNPDTGFWKFLHGAFDIVLEDGDLFIIDFGANAGMRVPKNISSSTKWDSARPKIYEMTNKSKDDEMTLDSRHVITSKKDVLRIKTVLYKAKNSL